MSARKCIATAQDAFSVTLFTALVAIPLLRIVATMHGFGTAYNVTASILAGIFIAYLIKTDVEQINKSLAYTLGWVLGNLVACLVSGDWWTFLLTVFIVLAIKISKYVYENGISLTDIIGYGPR